MSTEEANRAPAAPPGVVAALVGKPVFWALAVAVLLGWPIVGAVRRSVPPSPPVIAAVADFTLRDQTGRDYGSSDLRGRVWVADFIFTRCPTQCPRLTEKMARVQHRSRNLGDAIRLVSFTVDPEHDTPEVLAEYARAHRVSPRMWSLLTGARATIEKTVIGSLKAGMGRDGDSQSPDATFHDNHFVLVDQRMQIRGYYSPDDEGEIDRLMRDIALLIAHGG